MKQKLSILVYGYGNPGRQDDGLGIVVSEKAESWNLQGVETDFNYQLNAEDALAVSGRDVVIFADATVDESVSDFSFARLEPDMEIAFTTHAMSAGSVLALCKEIYKQSPDAYMLAVRGYSWDFDEGLSAEAEENLSRALAFLRPLLEFPSRDSFREAADKKQINAADKCCRASGSPDQP